LKKLIAIFFLSVLMFNIAGHLAFHQFIVYQTYKFFNKQIAKDMYNVSDLAEVAIPVNMPGIADQTSYEAISGQVKFDNASYNFVKMKVTQKAMYLMCVPNYESTQLHSDNVIVVKGYKEIPQKRHVPFGKLNIIVYNYQDVQYRFAVPLATLFKTKVWGIQNNYTQVHINSTAQPPDAAAKIS